MPALVETMMYAGETPWHKLGVKVESELTATAAMEKAGLDWMVEKVPVFTVDGSVVDPVKGKMAIRRVTDKSIYGIVGAHYEPLQNNEAFSFFDGVVGDNQAIYHTAGALDGGRLVWILAKLPEAIDVVPGDKVEQYVLLSNSHDGSRAVRMTWTPVRVVCYNTLSVALSGSRHGFYARHTINIQSKVVEARELLGLTQFYFRNFQEQVNALVKKRVLAKTFENILKSAYNVADEEYAKVEVRQHGKKEAVLKTMELFENGAGQDIPGVRGTAWAAFNATTEFIDHHKLFRKGNGEKHLQESWFGGGIELRQTVFDALVSL